MFSWKSFHFKQSFSEVFMFKSISVQLTWNGMEWCNIFFLARVFYNSVTTVVVVNSFRVGFLWHFLGHFLGHFLWHFFDTIFWHFSHLYAAVVVDSFGGGGADSSTHQKKPPIGSQMSLHKQTSKLIWEVLCTTTGRILFKLYIYIEWQMSAEWWTQRGRDHTFSNINLAWMKHVAHENLYDNGSISISPKLY